MLLGIRPCPLWSSCVSYKAVRAATIQAKMLVGTYRFCYHVCFWQHTSGACLLPWCVVFPGDVLYLFSSWSYLEDMLVASVTHACALLATYVPLVDLFHNKFVSSPFQHVAFLFDPSMDPDIILIRQQGQDEALHILFRVARMIIWPVHKVRLRAVGIGHYL